MICHRIWSGGQSALAHEISKTGLQVMKSNRAIMALAPELADAQRKLESSRAIGKQPDWSVLLALLAESLGQEVVLDRCELAAAGAPIGGGPLRTPSGGDKPARPEGDGRFVFRLSGFGRSQMAVSQFALRLERIGLFDQVRLIKTDRRPFLSGKAVAFRLECLLEGKGSATR